MERKHILRRNRARVSNVLSHRIVESLESMIFDILGKSRHHQMVLGAPDGSSVFPQKLGVAGPEAFGENAFWKITPKNKYVLGN